LVALALTACSNQGATKEEFDALKRRVMALEKKAKGMDQKGGKAKAPPSSPQKPPGPKTPIKVTGNAIKVVLTMGKRRIGVPAGVPEGDYTIHALFTQGAKPVEAGKLTVKGKTPITIDCSSESKKCEVAE